MARPMTYQCWYAEPVVYAKSRFSMAPKKESSTHCSGAENNGQYPDCKNTLSVNVGHLPRRQARSMGGKKSVWAGKLGNELVRGG